VDLGQAELRGVLDHVPFMICRCDSEGRYTFANRAYVERFKRTPDSVVGLHISDVIGQGAYRAIESYVARALAGERVEFELEIPYPAGRRIMRCSYQPERDERQQVAGFVAAITDETARLGAEEALRLSREHLEFIVASTEIGVWSCDLPFDVLNWNASCKEHFGLPPDAVVTINTFWERMHPDDVERTRLAIDSAIANRVSYDTEYRTLRADTGYRWIRAIGRAVYATDGTALRFDGVTVDISLQKGLEGLLREREAYFRTMADNAPAMIWLTAPDGRCTYLSKQWYDHTGVSPDEELLRGWLEHVHPDERESVHEMLIRAHANRTPFTVDYRLRDREGAYRWSVDAGLPRFTTEGEFQGFVGSVIDVHERKVVEQTLADTDRRKDEFLATLAHELRNPLAPLVTALRLIEQTPRESPVFGRAVSIMGRQLAQLVRLVDDLLEFSRITRGKLQLRLERATLSQAVQAAVEAATVAISAKGQRLTVAIPEEPVYLHADPTRLAQVFLNLLNNAAKYTQQGGEIALRASVDAGRVVILVTDNGIGFSPEAADRIFEMFVQADESRDLAQGGLGIGLTLVRQLVEMHHGQVSARSDGAGRGSEFRISLPVMDALEVQAADHSAPPPQEGPARRVLIADDNTDAAMSLALLLEQAGHEVRTVHDGESALTMASTFQPDLVLLDIGMPRLNGYETAKRMRELPFGSTMLIAAVTGWGQPQDHERSRAAGIDLHFRKPLEHAQLEQLLRDRPRSHPASAGTVSP
jgi:PAS domain S-box-containing protein